MPAKPSPEIVDLNLDELQALLRRVEGQELSAEDFEILRAVCESYLYVTQLIDQKSTTIARLRKLLFGTQTESTSAVTGRQPDAAASGSQGEATDQAVPAEPSSPKPKAKGHGRNGADDYPAATRVRVRHKSLEPGDACPRCERGTVYAQAQPGTLLRFTGAAPIQATVYELQKLRCQLCGQIFTASAPDAASDDKYDATVASMIGLLKYGSGFPFNRLDGLQASLGVPLPASTQWDIVAAAYPQLKPVHDELVRQAAQGEVLHNDDTTVKILELMGERAKAAALAELKDDGPKDDGPKDKASNAGAASDPNRKGLFTSGVVATREGCRIALFFSGRRHAGENLRDVLRRRAADLPPPIQMCDALSRNRPAELETIIANCMAHARRQFVDVHANFPSECRHVLESIEAIYRHDQQAREQRLNADERLRYHQQHSGPIMDELRGWLKRQIDEKFVEPHSGLGAAIGYLRKHWDKLTLFLRVAGAPLDNNLCERALKKAILHRKNALFFKTRNGAAVGDLYMSLIHTCELCKANPFDYLTELQRHAEAVAAAPQNWLPWNYRDNLKDVSNAA